MKKKSTNSTWENYYLKTPLDKIPWQKTQYDYFLELIDSSKLGQGKALDLGCGVGIKSIALAKKGFVVTGIDISPTAISCAKKNAKNEKVDVNFITGDATDLSFLGTEKFDFVLDWANLHGISKTKQSKYANQIIKHTKKESKLLLRCFGRLEAEKEHVNRPMGTIYRFSKKDIDKLFGKHFKILETNKSSPFTKKGKEPPAKWLGEYLMERVNHQVV